MYLNTDLIALCSKYTELPYIPFTQFQLFLILILIETLTQMVNAPPTDGMYNNKEFRYALMNDIPTCTNPMISRNGLFSMVYYQTTKGKTLSWYLLIPNADSSSDLMAIYRILLQRLNISTQVIKDLRW